VLKKAWMTQERVIMIKVLRHCFVKLSSAIGYVNNSFDQFWLMDTLQLTVTTVSTLSRIVQSPEKFSEKTYLQIILAAISIIRLLLLALCCGDASDEVNLQLENVSITILTF
jgi:hypothetical protein